VTIVDRLDDATAHQLLTTPPDEFVVARNALVKQLKAQGERDRAAEVGALRRPSWVDWALNLAAVEHTADVERFAEAAELMRDAQRGAVTGREGVDLRAAMTGLRDRTGELARKVNGVLTGHGRPAALPDITERLAEIATSDASTEQLRTGLLLGEAGGDGVLGFGTDAVDEAPSTRKPKPVQAPAKTPSTKAPAKKASAKNASANKAAAQEEPAASGPDHTFERRRIERELKTAERVSQAARRDADRADTAVRHAKTAVDAATDAVKQAQSSLDRAERRLQREEADRQAARQKSEAAAADVARLRDALDQL
jgi:hypothetical protein